MENQDKQPIDFSQLSREELQAELQRREALEKKEKKKAIDLHIQAKETFISETVAEFERLREIMINTKRVAVKTGNKLYVEMFDVHGKEPKKVKQFSFMNKAKTMKIVVDNAEVLGFSDESIVAIEGIKDFFKDKFEKRSKLVYSVLDTLLSKNNKGDYDPRLLTKIRKEVVEINDPTLTKYYEILRDSQIVTDTALYLRAYKKDKTTGKMSDIVVQFSAL